MSATGSATYRTGSQSASGAATPATIHFDLATLSYTVTTSSGTQTFRPSDLSATDSTPQVAVYIRRNGATSDSLSLTKPGTSGRFTYQYVGGAYWQHVVDASTSVTGSIDAIAYGLATPDNAVPQTGTADYAVDILGVEAAYGGIVGFAGSGVTQVDFGRGALVTHGFADFSLTPHSAFVSEARLSSVANSFEGEIRFDDFGLFSGPLTGKFFGSNAEELGAAFYATNGGQRVAVGTLLGRGASVSRHNTSINNPTVSEFFTGEGAVLTGSLPGGSGRNIDGPGFTDTGVSPGAVIVNYDATTQTYSIISPAQSQNFTNAGVSFGRVAESLRNTTPTSLGDGIPYATFTNLKSVATRTWVKEQSIGGRVRETIQPFAYGLLTPNNAVPRTGTGDYMIGVTGTAMDGDFINLMEFAGAGALNVNFATGAISTNGSLRYLEDYLISGFRPRGTATGTFSGTAQLSSTSNSFTGPITVTGLGPYTGTLSGHFFGAAGEEVGGSFQATDGAGGVLAAAFAGGLDPAATPVVPTLSTLFTDRPLTFYQTHYQPDGTFTNQIVDVSFAMQGGSPTVLARFNDPHLAGAPTYFAPLNNLTINTAASGASYDVYDATVAGRSYVVSMLKALPSNPTLALSYTSFAQFAGTTQPNPLLPSDRHYVAFGLRSTQLQMPLGGTATYNGIAVGTGSVEVRGPGTITTDFYDLSGTTAMTANFTTGLFTSSLNLTGTNIAGGATHIFAPLNFTGDITGSDFSTHQNGMTYVGSFFGPGAAEIGGKFDVFQSDFAGTTIDLQGVFVGGP